MNTQKTQLWPTPVLTVEYDEDINATLANIILDKENEILAGTPVEVAGLKEGLTAHWLEFNVLRWDFEECRQLRQRVLKGYKDYCDYLEVDYLSEDYRICGISCWANILRNGEGLLIHHHDPAFVSAHFQVQSIIEDNVPEGSGDTVYYRPGFIERTHGDRQAGSLSVWDTDWKIHRNPKPGRLVFFPSYMRHEVRPYIGNRERISVALDIYIAKQQALINFGSDRWYVPTMEEIKEA